MLNGSALAQSLLGGITQDVVNGALTEALIGAHVPTISELMTTKFNEKLDPAEGVTLMSNVTTPLLTTLTLEPLCVTPEGVKGINTLPVNAQSNVKVIVVVPQVTKDGLGATDRASNEREKMMNVKNTPNLNIDP